MLGREVEVEVEERKWIEVLVVLLTKAKFGPCLRLGTVEREAWCVCVLLSLCVA